VKRLQLNEEESIPGFQDHLNQKIFPENLVDLKNALNTVPISSHKCEQGFSQMNLIYSSTSASLSTTTVCVLFFPCGLLAHLFVTSALQTALSHGYSEDVIPL
jgi:hypothetical protein